MATLVKKCLHITKSYQAVWPANQENIYFLKRSFEIIGYGLLCTIDIFHCRECTHELVTEVYFLNTFCSWVSFCIHFAKLFHDLFKMFFRELAKICAHNISTTIHTRDWTVVAAARSNSSCTDKINPMTGLPDCEKNARLCDVAAYYDGTI